MNKTSKLTKVIGLLALWLMTLLIAIKFAASHNQNDFVSDNEISPSNEKKAHENQASQKIDSVRRIELAKVKNDDYKPLPPQRIADLENQLKLILSDGSEYRQTLKLTEFINSCSAEEKLHLLLINEGFDQNKSDDLNEILFYYLNDENPQKVLQYLQGLSPIFEKEDCNAISYQFLKKMIKDDPSQVKLLIDNESDLVRLLSEKQITSVNIRLNLDEAFKQIDKLDGFSKHSHIVSIAESIEKAEDFRRLLEQYGLKKDTQTYDAVAGIWWQLNQAEYDNFFKVKPEIADANYISDYYYFGSPELKALIQKTPPSEIKDSHCLAALENMRMDVGKNKSLFLLTQITETQNRKKASSNIYKKFIIYHPSIADDFLDKNTDLNDSEKLELKSSAIEELSK